ncbi:hypothetical protein FOQG_17633 [Fusarium oxysporum f. sp. raphani 54005]|uniref:Uncharacterized protein n=1 Tax=Fusarium oxysporum f. sp. raphani 54005 TaxID=1089458 RepID=X0B6D2_FUSOX|nr:hypothetical protein FOQG_17633 [Fusarium oxysporum f. sp. raphani 54005]
MAAFLPALPSPESWSHIQEYTVVSNEAFQGLVKRSITLEDDCHMTDASILHEKKTFHWNPKDNKLWCIPISREELIRRSDCYLMSANEFISLEEEVVKVKSGKDARNEARSVVALVRKTDGAHLGYYGGNWYDGLLLWIISISYALSETTLPAVDMEGRIFFPYVSRKMEE